MTLRIARRHEPTGAIQDGAEVADRSAKEAQDTSKRGVCGCAATFQCEVEELVDMEEVNKKANINRGVFGFKEAEVRKLRMVRAVEGKRMFQRIRCGMRSLWDRVLGVCVWRPVERGKNTRHSWKDTFMGGTCSVWSMWVCWLGCRE